MPWHMPLGGHPGGEEEVKYIRAYFLCLCSVLFWDIFFFHFVLPLFD